VFGEWRGPDCNSSSRGGTDMMPASDFLTQLNTGALPPEVVYVSLIGSAPPGCGWVLGTLNVVVPEPNDCIVPADSQHLGRTAAAEGRAVQAWTSAKTHLDETKDLNGILRGLELARMRLQQRIVSVEVHSPIDIIVTDPIGRRVGKDIAEIPWATYDEFHGADGDLHDSVIIPLALPGDYRVTAVADANAAPSDTYSIVVHDNGREVQLAHDVPISELPSDPYVFSTMAQRYFAEGATGNVFTTRLALLNVGSTATSAHFSHQTGSGAVVVHDVPVPTLSRVTVDSASVPGLASAEFSTLVESDQPLIVDRTMYWSGSSAYGAHAETAIESPSQVWYLAEGATHGGFDLFYLLQNPTTAPTDVRVRYLRPVGDPLEKIYTLPPTSRTNVWVDLEDFPGLGTALANTDVSAVVESLDGTPIIVERAMYLTGHGHGRMFDAGHESAGIRAPASQWVLAEGATGSFFDLFVLVANPTGTTASIEAQFLLPSGEAVRKTYDVAPNSRFNIWVDLEDPRLADTAVSTTVVSLNDVPIIVERAMWWPGDDWHEAHNSPGATTTGTAWAMAEGEVDSSRNLDTYILIANTSASSATVDVTLFFEDGSSSQRRYQDLPAHSRFNVSVAHQFPNAAGRRFGALVESLGDPAAEIVVERAMYWDAAGQSWAAGTNALATRLR
jgi:hypothetical protein